MENLSRHALTAFTLPLTLLATSCASPTAPASPYTYQLAKGTVTEIDPRHGNVYTTLKRSDHERLGLQPGQRLRLNLAGRPPVELTVVWTYTDVEVGQPAAVLHREGLTFAIRDGRFADAYGVAEGDGFILWGR